MNYELPPLNGLLAFEAAARHENFARAAEELNLSQATVSHRVRMLEKKLGYTLFERLPRGLKLTESGKAYLPSIRKAFEQIFASTSGIFGRKQFGSLTVRAPVSYTALWLSPLIDGFLKTYPGIDVRLISSIWADAISKDDIDIDLRLGFGNWPDCQTEKVYTDKVVPVCAPSMIKKFPKIRNSILQINTHSLIHVMGIEDLWMKYFEFSGVNYSSNRHDIRVDSALSALEIASSSHRIGLLQTKFLDRYIESGRLCIISDLEMEIEQSIYLVTSNINDREKPEALLFKDWLFSQQGPASTS